MAILIRDQHIQHQVNAERLRRDYKSLAKTASALISERLQQINEGTSSAEKKRAK